MEKKNRNIQAVMLEAYGLVGKVGKNAKNPFFKSNYADINNVLDTIAPVCSKLGLVVIQAPKLKQGNDVLNTVISLAENPEQLVESDVRLLLPSADMQKLGSAITYARRYSLISLFL